MERNTHPTEVLDVRIEELDYKGRGVARYFHPPVKGANQGRQLKIIIPNVVPGDVVRVTVPNAKGRRKAMLDYDEIIQISPDRDTSQVFERESSGGTPLRYMNYDAQLRYKEEKVKTNLAEFDFDIDLVKPIIGMDNPDRYRNKMELTFGPNGELGMHKVGNFNEVIDLKDSIIAPKEMIEIKTIISKWQNDYGLTGYNKENDEGLLRNVLMRYSFAYDEMMVVVYATEDTNSLTVEIEDLTKRLTDSFQNIVSIQWKKDSSISEGKDIEHTEIVSGRDFIYDELNGYKYRVWPETFFQVNPSQAKVLVQQALEMAEVNKEMRVIDLYCGIGTFSLPFAERSKELAGVEIVETSILSARRNAHDNGIDNTYFKVGDARHGLLELQEEWGTADLLILDPPRSGAGGKAMRAIGRLDIPQIIYISCGVKALAKDLTWLRELGYELKTVQPVDQFPHTIHVENVVLLTKV